ncbi:MAG: c-type cytochrome [Paracoccaceae bacterium]
MASFFLRNLTAVLLLVAPAAGAQEKRIVLASELAVTDTGLWSYVLPRFSLKTGIPVTLISAEASELAGIALAGEADLVVLAGATAADSLVASGAAGEWRGIMTGAADDGGPQWIAALVDPDKRPAAARQYAVRLLDWLVSDIGQRTITGYRRDGRQVFFARAETTREVEQAPVDGNVRVGEKLALRHCGRCHVIGEQNKYGGIDSTPSFPALRTLADWKEKFGAFWTKNPHPSFLQVKGLTEGFDAMRPPGIHPIHLTLTDVEDIGAFLLSVEPRDLGGALRAN